MSNKRSSGIGIMGITPQSKGLHRALAMLDLLCKSSPSATLKIKGKLPREYPWMKRRVEENNWYEGLLTSYPHLFENNKIIHEGFTPDVSHFVATSKSVLSVSSTMNHSISRHLRVQLGAPLFICYLGKVRAKYINLVGFSRVLRR